MNQLSEVQNKQVGKKTEDVAENVIVFDVRKLTRFREEGPSVQILSDSGAARMVLFAFKAGQQLKEHTTSSQILVHGQRGRIPFTANGTSTRLQTGTVLQLAANVPHSLNALTDASVLVTMTPSPAFHSLEREVFQDLSPLVTRGTDG